jgi:hypothetical protein
MRSSNLLLFLSLVLAALAVPLPNDSQAMQSARTVDSNNGENLTQAAESTSSFQNQQTTGQESSSEEQKLYNAYIYGVYSGIYSYPMYPFFSYYYYV